MNRKTRSGTADAAALTIALTTLALILFLLASGPRAAYSSPEDPPVATGLHALERAAADGTPFRWTTGQARFTLPNPGGPLQLELQLAAGARQAVTAELSGLVDVRLSLGPELRRYQLLAPAQPGERVALLLTAPPFTPAGEAREVGVVLGDVALHGGGTAPRALYLAALATAAALYLAARSAMPALVAAPMAVLASGALLSWQLAGRWAVWPFAPLGALAALTALAAALGWQLWLTARARWQTARPAAQPLHPAFVTVGLGLYLAAALWNHRNVHPGLALDLGIYLRAGQLALAGQSPYDPPELQVIGVSFVYPPPAVPLFAALAASEPPLVYGLWLIGNLALFLFALLASYAALPGRPVRGALLTLIVLGLGFAPFLEALAIGQINSLMLLGLALFVLGHTNRRLAWAGDLGLAAVILIKLTPTALLLWPLVRGDWQRLARVVAGMLLLALPALFCYGVTPWRDFARLLPALFAGVPRNPYNQALAAVLTGLATPGSPTEQAAAWLGRVFSLGLFATWTALCWRRRGDHDGAALAFGVAALTVGSSLIWYHHLMFLSLPLAWLGLTTPRGSRRQWAALLALGLIQATRPIEFGLGMPPWPAVAGYLVLSLALGVWLWQRPDHTGASDL